MAVGLKHGTMGSPLNFKVVGGTTAPANPRENTIWINTDTEITHTLFCPVDPGPVMNGLVWIVTGTSGATGFNALKKNGMVIFPNSAKQYVNSKWVPKPAQIWMNGVWVSLWDGGLYVEGDEYTHITGGWKGYNYRRIASQKQYNPIVTKGASSMSVEVGGMWWNPSENANNRYSGTLFTENAIDLSGFSKLKINITAISGTADSIWFGVSSDKKDAFTRIAEVNAKTTGTTTLDISSVNQVGYIFLALYIPSSTTKVTFDKIWVE